MLTQARDGFFLNLGNVMLKLCQPFLELSGKSKKALRINSLFCLVDANINDIARVDCPIHLVQNQEDPKIAKRPDESMCFCSIWVIPCLTVENKVAVSKYTHWY